MRVKIPAQTIEITQSTADDLRAADIKFSPERTVFDLLGRRFRLGVGRTFAFGPVVVGEKLASDVVWVSGTSPEDFEPYNVGKWDVMDVFRHIDSGVWKFV